MPDSFSAPVTLDKKIQVLTTPLTVTNYRELSCFCYQLDPSRPVLAFDFTNTHIVAWRAHDPSFAGITDSMDHFIPDGMPLVWRLNSQGAGLKDRVYGPSFMWECLRSSPSTVRHYFLGGSEKCLQRLMANLRALNPGLTVAGARSGYFQPHETAGILEGIRSARPDLIWLGLGTPKQQEFIAAHKHAIDHGSWLAVGFAFDVNAGTKRDAPLWMQKLGLTWLYRISQEPKRLLPRYLKYNTLFLFYLLLEIGGVSFSRSKQRRIAFLGIRGIPGRYSGFETFVEELGPRLVRDGWDVTVYCRSHLYPERQKEFQGMKLVYLPAIRSKSLETITHTVLSCLHSVLHRYDLVYLCGVGNALTSAILHLGGSRVVINVDGDDFRRPKWHWFARWWLRKSESWATRLADRVIADNTAIQKRYQQSYGFMPDLIGYGAPLAERPKSTEILQRLGVRDRDYILCVGRISPENRVDLLVRAHKKSGVHTPLVIVGSYGYETRYYEECQRAAAQNVVFAGPVYGDGYRELSLHAKMFVLPAAIEATRVVLVDQLGFGAAIVFQDCPASREVLGEAGEPFAPEQPEESLAQTLRELDVDAGRLQQLRAGALARAQACYNWEKVTEQYEALFREVLPATRTA